MDRHKSKRALEKRSLAPSASRRRKELLELLDQLDPKIVELTAAVEQEANQGPEVLLLRTHPGVGPISKQGNALLRFLLVEAAQAAARCNPDWRRRYLHLMMRREKRIAKVAMARKLAVRLYWMWRNGWDHSQSLEFGSYAGQLGTVHGAK